MTKLQELLLAAGSAANGATSHTLRAIACRNIDRLGEEWTIGLPMETSLLVTAIATSVRALAGASSDETRSAIAIAIKQLVVAARTRRIEPKPRRVDPRLYWIEADR